MGKFKCLGMGLLSTSYQVMSELSVVHIPGYNDVNPIENNKHPRNCILFL